MPKTASDPTNREPISAGRKAMVFGASYSGNTDLPTVSSSLIISASAAGTVDVIMPDSLDGTTISIPVQAGMVQLAMQVRQIVSTSSGVSVVALWS